MFGFAAEQTVTAATLAQATVAYVAAVFAYHAVMRLTFEEKFRTLGASVAVAAIVAMGATGADSLWLIALTLGVVVVSGLICGRLAKRGWRFDRAYIVGLLAALVFFAVQYAPYWPELMANAREAANTALQQFGAASAGSSEDLGNVPRVFNAVVRLTPAFTIMSGALQFSLGFLLFAFVVSRKYPWVGTIPFTRWQAPFAATPLLAGLILLRFFGTETLVLVADNALFCLSLYYCVAGLAVIEYHLDKLMLGGLMKTFFYILLFFTGLIGFAAAALLGFADSFFEWRKEKETDAQTT